MILAQKWDFEGREYRPYEIPDGLYCPLSLSSMNTVINCASCGKKLVFGDSYTSRCIHNAAGLGYAVCAACHDKEFAAERAAYKENNQ